MRLKAIVDIDGDIVRTRDDADRRGFHEDARTTAPFKLLFDCEGAYFDLRPRTLALLAQLEATFELEVWVSESD